MQVLAWVLLDGSALLGLAAHSYLDSLMIYFVFDKVEQTGI